MANIFISYAQGDRAWVRDLASTLEAEGFSVWWDQELLPGARFRMAIIQALEEANAVIVVWSQLSIASDWVLGEANDARSAGKLIPVLKEQVRPPTEFRGIQNADLSQWHGDRKNRAFGRVANAVRALLERSSARERSEAGETALSSAPAPVHIATRLQGLRTGKMFRWVFLATLAFAMLSLVSFATVSTVQFLNSDDWLPTLSSHVKVTLSNADAEVHNARGAAEIARSELAETTTLATNASSMARDAEKAADVAAAKTITHERGYGTLSGTFDGYDWIYRGQVSAGHPIVAEGYGVKDQKISDSYLRYAGIFHKGLADGYGVQTAYSGYRYEGQWSEGVASGPYFVATTKIIVEGKNLVLSCLNHKRSDSNYATCLVGDKAMFLGTLTTQSPALFLPSVGVMRSKQGIEMAGDWFGVYSDGKGYLGELYLGTIITANSTMLKGQFTSGQLSGYGAKYDSDRNLTEQGRYDYDGTLTRASQ